MLKSNAPEYPSAEVLGSSASDGESPFRALVSEREVSVAHRADDSFVAECTDTRHPTLTGRVQIAWQDESGQPRTLWAPVLAHLSLRASDRVLVLRPRSFPEPLVVGVVAVDDGRGARPEPLTVRDAVLEVKPGKKLQIILEDGTPLVEVTHEGEGPVVRVMSATTQLELPGHLQITADEIVLRARQGQVKIAATDDVVVTGQKIRLN